MMPALMLYIPAKANPLGNFDRWAIFASLSRPKHQVGKASHEQVVETTAESNGTEWRFVVDHGTKQNYLHNPALAGKPYPHVDVVVPVGAPECVQGHDTAIRIMGTCALVRDWNLFWPAKAVGACMFQITRIHSEHYEMSTYP